MAWNDLSPRWQEYFIKQLHTTAEMSKDANTQVGCLIIDTVNKVVVSSGWNCLPRGVIHTPERSSRPLKYTYTSHAEMSCLTNALRLRSDVVGHTMLVTLACCPTCACSVINSGLAEVVSPAPDFSRATYGEDFKHTLQMFSESSVTWIFCEDLHLAKEI